MFTINPLTKIQTANAEILYVGNPGNYSSIQEAINNANDSDTIFVFNKVYLETINITTNNLTIIGEDMDNTIIDANKTGNAVNIKADNVTISNLAITNANNNGIYLELAKDIEISNCYIYDNGESGVLINLSNNNTITDCFIESNGDSGVLINSSNNNTIKDCVTESNGQYGILLYASKAGQTTNNNNISNCEIFYNDYSGIRITNEFEIGGYSSADNNQITNCEISCNGYKGKSDQDQAGLSISPKGKVTNTLVTNCVFYLPYSKYNVHIEGQIVENNTIHHNNFLSEPGKVYDEEENIWHQQINETTGEGNYWTCFDEPSEGAYDDDSDGIIDDPYDIPGGNNKDHYPLAEPLFGITVPVADANGPYNAEVDEIITFDGSGSTGSITKYEWNFGDGNAGTSVSPKHPYATAGTYTVTLTVEDEYGLTDTTTTTATITEPPEEPEEPENIPPIADAGGPYYEFAGVAILFDGSDSYDPDGSSISYRWSFGDGATSTKEMPSHAYSKAGNYTIRLTVTDEKGATDTDTASASITKKPNNPPEKPIVNGIETGHINISYNYTANASDPDDDMIQYVFNWSDGTNDTISPLLNSNEQFNTSHNWTVGGIYVIKVYTKDENNATSDTQSLKVLIDAHYCGSLGYLVDKNGNGTYDVFYRETTGRETETEKDGDEYYIDINNDGKWDYIYNFTTDKISDYPAASVSEEKEDSFSLETKWILLIVFIVAILILAIAKIAISRWQKPKEKTKKKEKKIKKEKPKKVKKPKKNKKRIKIRWKKKTKATKAKDKKIKKLEKKVDQLLSDEKTKR